MFFQSSRFRFILSLASGALMLSGCHHPLVYNKNIQQAPTKDPSVYTVEEYNTDKAEFIKATDPKDDTYSLQLAQMKRNDIVWGLMTDAEIVYNAKYGRLFGGRNVITVIGDGVTLGLGAAGSIATNAATKTIFAALGTGISGLNLSISKNFYAEQSFQIIGIAMQTRRDKIRTQAIQTGLTQDLVTYPLNRAKRDLITYIQAGTLAAGLQELQEEAGVATGALKGPAASTSPNIPGAVSATKGVGQVTLTWTSVPGAIFYNVYSGQSTPLNKQNANVISTTNTYLVQGGLDPAKLYYYAVSAINNGGESLLSDIANAQPNAPPLQSAPNLPAPTNLKVLPVPSGVFITFDAPAGAATFEIYQDSTSSPSKKNKISPSGLMDNQYLYVDPDASKGFYSAVALDQAGHAGTQTAAVPPAAQPLLNIQNLLNQSGEIIIAAPSQLH